MLEFEFFPKCHVSKPDLVNLFNHCFVYFRKDAQQQKQDGNAADLKRIGEWRLLAIVFHEATSPLFYETSQ